MLDLAQGLPAVVAHVPGEGVPTAASLSFRSPSGEVLATPTVTIDSTGPLTVTAVSSPRIVSFAAVTGLVVGMPYWWTGVRGGGGVVYVSEIDTLTVTLESAPPGTMRIGDTLTGVRCTATIPDTATTDLGLHYLLRWRTTIGGATVDGAESAAVVAQKFAPPMTTSEAARYVAGAYPSMISQGQDGGRWRAMAERASRAVRKAAIMQERYPHLSGDHTIWGDAGLAALRLELAKENTIAQIDSDRTRSDLERDLEDEVRKVFTGAPQLAATTDVQKPVQTAGSRRVRRVS